MRNDLTVSRSITITATPTAVWSVLTEPAKIKEYLFGTDTTTDWKEGSEIVFTGEYEGKEYRDHGTILTNVPEEKIVYSYWSNFSGVEDKPENYSEITYELSQAEDHQTVLSWTQKGYASEEGYQHSDAMIKGLLDKIKEIAERK
ncbi:SRPBCC family protein [Brevibacillus dissolubilis]|uniref:SRPBCC family protein n=1 Tax=Brevibacillus dissolubilis TaxID=1844116 RepID=UPI001115D356|nr:SRPBCC family protein [Brevibacillus dissolubilis]